MEVQTVQTLSVVEKNKYWEIFRNFASDIKLSHSLFAMPFVGVTLTCTGIAGITLLKFVEIIVCMIMARSFAMGFNRYVDRDIDAQNVRTEQRALPSGKVHHRKYLFLTVFCGVAFCLTAFSLSLLAGFCSPFLLIVLASYSFMKRISWLTHWYLGICLGLAPLATEIALFNRVSLPVLFIGIAVASWTAGFDLLYSLQDREFDIAKGLHSAPARFGFRAAIWMSRVSFMAMVLLLYYAGILNGSGLWWHVGVVFVALILIYEHWVIRDAMTLGKSAKINLAFFNLNAGVSVFFFLFSIVDCYVRS